MATTIDPTKWKYLSTLGYYNYVGDPEFKTISVPSASRTAGSAPTFSTTFTLAYAEAEYYIRYSTSTWLAAVYPYNMYFAPSFGGTFLDPASPGSASNPFVVFASVKVQGTTVTVTVTLYNTDGSSRTNPAFTVPVYLRQMAPIDSVVLS